MSRATFAKSPVSLLLTVLLVLPARLTFAAGNDVERAVVLVELRTGTEANSLTTDYLKELDGAFKSGNFSDFILVSQEKAVDKLQKEVDQVPAAINDERRQQLSEGRKKGIELLVGKKPDPKAAIAQLTVSEQRYRSALASPGADEQIRKQYLEVLGYLAYAYVSAKEVESAKEVYRTVITTFPAVKNPISDNDYPPDVVEIYKGVAKDLKAQKLGTVEVTSTPPGARVILGGTDRGATPATVSDLVPGQYSLRLQQGSQTSLLHRVRVTGGATVKAQIDLGFENHLLIDEHQLSLTYPDEAAAVKTVAQDATSLGASLGVDLVAVVGVLDGKLTTYVVDVSKRGLLRNHQAKVPKIGISKNAVSSTLATVIGRSVESADGGGVAKSGGDSSGNPLLVPAIVGGAGVVLAAVGLAVGAPSVQVRDSATGKTIDYSPLFSGASLSTNQADADTIQGKRTTGAVLLGVGVAAVATGVVLFVLNKNGSNSAQLAPGVREGLPPAEFGFAPTQFAAAR